MILGLTGAAGSGKDTVANYLVSAYGFKRHAFADLLYEEVSAAFDVPFKVLARRDTKERPMDALKLSRCHKAEFTAYLMAKEAPKLDAVFSPRYILQRWGDFRRAKQPDYFVEPVISDIRAEPQMNHVVSDMRFPNEHAALMSLNAFFWRIERTGISSVSAHISETALAEAVADKTVFNHGTIHDLQRVVDRMLLDAEVA
ncbi:deoxynucleotide monophosphate kinase family protein [Acidihalobacter prosperus]|uniref:Deoxynucleotide monophosphate kinase n=1 Tax=Acidihalobacter prosperus TaxID=160660 RepID=A0A1A6C310_9GAMM|nr:hypothetical protein [Acidihalobacter prosperus]OBS08948.1 hypothetical protein Thpro_022065 [Acidihalobacter prosperus]